MQTNSGNLPGGLPGKNAAAPNAFNSITDPFGEHATDSFHQRARVLGGRFDFESNSRQLLQLVDVAYESLPAHAFSSAPPRFRIKLLLNAAEDLSHVDEPPPPKMHSGAGLLCGTVDAANFAVVSPHERAGLVVASRGMLSHPYHTRYELIEFAVFTLATRAQRLISLHAACVGRNGRGLLLIGPTGTGKTTLALHCLLQGMELVAEDGVFIAPQTLLATGIASFLHLRADSLKFLESNVGAQLLGKSTVIRRRSGVEKFEVDVRATNHRIARKPLEIAAVVFLSKRGAALNGNGIRSLLVPLQKPQLLEKMRESQQYAAHQPGWLPFEKRIGNVEAFELRRGRHPEEAAQALRRLIG